VTTLPRPPLLVITDRRQARLPLEAIAEAAFAAGARWLSLREKDLSPMDRLALLRRLSAIGAGFAGVLLILRPGTGAFDIWSAVALAAMLLIVVRDIATRLFSAAVGTSTIAFYAALSVMASGFVMGVEESWRMPDGREALMIVLSAAFLTTGYVTAVATMRVGEISFVAPFRYTSLLWAIGLGLAFFGEWPDRWTWAGSALVVGAGIYSILRERRLGRGG
jgi:drug/metabolite transporter (DMT)-like permease